jgi:hypothetical protein
MQRLSHAQSIAALQTTAAPQAYEQQLALNFYSPWMSSTGATVSMQVLAQFHGMASPTIHALRANSRKLK